MLKVIEFIELKMHARLRAFLSHLLFLSALIKQFKVNDGGNAHLFAIIFRETYNSWVNKSHFSLYHLERGNKKED